MLPFTKYLPLLLLTLLVPLALLAWFGSREMTRLEEHSASQLQGEARNFLVDEEKKVRFEIERVADEALNTGIGTILTESRIVEASKRLSALPYILHAFVAGEEFELIRPLPSRSPRPSAPLAALPEDQDEQRDLWKAEILYDFHDDEGAIHALESYIARYAGAEDRNEGLMWAYFRLAGLLSKVAQSAPNDDRRLERIQQNYLGALVKAENLQPPTADSATMILLCQLRERQLIPDPDRTLELLERIASGRQPHLEYIGEDVLEWVIADIVEKRLPAGDPKIAARRDASLALNRVRAALRRFADDYDELARARLLLDHRAKRLHSYKDILFQAMTTGQGTGLLALRPSTQKERRVFGRGARWVGLLLDLPAIIGSTSRSTSENFALSVFDPSGVPLLDGQPPVPLRDNPGEAPAVQFAPVTSHLAGLEFVAIPVTDPAELLSAARNQGILVLILVVVALTGAFMLVRSAKRETELAQTKVNLLSRVSHELKTPLAVIKMYGETLGLGRTTDPGQVSRFAGIISGEADRLTGMVERILDFSKMEAGTFTYEKEDIDLGEVVEAVTEEYQPHIESQGLRLDSDIVTGLSSHADPRGLASALVNLLENALKYTPDTAPDRSLAVSLVRRNGDAVLEVRDHGVGIPRDELHQVFADFYRASNAGEVRGAGIGLSIVAHFARSHGGKVEALPQDDGGTGTIMRLTLPLNGSDSAHQT